jgi:hypothetical protein
MFIVNSGSEALPEVKRKLFHSKTAKSLYLAKRACPDILTTVIFLCMRYREQCLTTRFCLVYLGKRISKDFVRICEDSVEKWRMSEDSINMKS